MKGKQIDTTLLARGFRFSKEDMEIIAKIPHPVLVRNHLLRYGNITDNEARDYYRINRLSAVIYILRYKYSPRMIIDTVPTNGRNSFGRSTRFGTYIYKGDVEE